MRTLVTGGAGFIGSTLVDRLLAEGREVEVLDDLSSGSLSNLADARAERTHRLTFHQIDVVDERAVDLIAIRAPEVVYHLAGRAGVRRSVRRPLDDATVNVVGTLNVLEGARRAGARKVVVAASGGTAYGEVRPRNLPAKESHALAPQSPHGVSARVVLEYLRLYRQLHDVEYTALALANVYGPRQLPADADGQDGVDGGVIATFAARLLAGEECTIHGDGEQTRDFLYVDDCVDAFVRAGERGDGLVINVGTGVETSVNDLYVAMASATGVDRPARQAAAHAGEVQRSALDAGRAAIQLGWRPWTPVEEGVARVLEWHAGRT
ncbi:MAG TPA: NAD-dependent epimerase/dehydratase family protein [Acidimicrobiales bacterium]|nr:NAD-dependent epimerase/dehydratase family protein [Acidimicrobiales bacterium]